MEEHDPLSSIVEPFKDLSISPNWKQLAEIYNRYKCQKCQRSRKLFCYTCYIPNPLVEDIMPNVELPFAVDIIKHAREIDGKSTSVHAVLLAPGQVSIYTYPNIPDYSNDHETILIYPGKSAITLNELLSKNCENRRSTDEKKCAIKKAVFIDSTWTQSKAIYNHIVNSADLPCVILENRVSQFWRHQKGSPRWYLATIEAIHQFFVEYNDNVNVYEATSPRYDDLLFFFRHMYDLIHRYYDHNRLLAYRRPLR